VAISTVLWFLNALNKYYETTINYPVHYSNLPEGLYLASTPPQALELIVEAHGFTLLRRKLNLDFIPIELDVQRMLLSAEKLDSRSYRVSTVTLLGKISDQLSSEIKLLEVRPLSLILELDGLTTREVKVVPDVEIDFAPQYNLSAAIKVEPAFVMVTGPVSVIDTLKTIRTQRQKLSRIDKTSTLSVPLATSGSLKSVPEKVSVTIPTEEFTEKVLVVGVKITGKPENTSIKLFPSEVKLSFLVGLKNYSSITPENFEATIPYSDLNSSSVNATVKVTRYPDFVYDVKCSPPAVEFLIEEQ
jgi:hypothetical protein